MVPKSGWSMLIAILVALVVSPVLFIVAVNSGPGILTVVIAAVAIVVGLGALIGLCGFMAIQPNDSRVLLLFGDYTGTVSKSGFYWVNPFFTKKKISLRIRNFETGSTNVGEKKNEAGVVVQQKTRTNGRPSKVNDRDGNPIEISAVVVWKVVNTAEALFEVDDY